MNTIMMLITSWCPYCKKAASWIEEIKKENPKYADVKVKIVDEELEPSLAKQYDYYYVPTYFVNGVKIHEGATSKNQLIDAFEAASK
jgi:glutaredoxin